MNIDLYEMAYRNYKYFEKNKPDTNINITEKTRKSVWNVLIELKHIESKKRCEIRFSNVVCNVLPVFDEETHNLSYRNEFMFTDGSKECNPNENVERFKKLDINTLPLIEVAKYLNIQVEKSNILEPYGLFSPTKSKITLGSDYAPTFIHELAHAVDHILRENYYVNLPEDTEVDKDLYGYLDENEDLDELVAELSAVVLCKTYNISKDVSYAKYYLDGYSNSEINGNDLIKRVSLICEYVNKCIENIENKGKIIPVYHSMTDRCDII